MRKAHVEERGLQEKTALIGEFISAQLALQQERLFLWLPVFLSLGIGVYFFLQSEPLLIIGVVAVFLTVFLLWMVRRHAPARIAGLLLFLVAVGFLAGQFRTIYVYTPLLQKKLEPVMVTGTIQSIEALEEGKGSRSILSDLTVEKLRPENTPVKIRLSIRRDKGLQPGQRIEVLASLNPPSSPIMPGAFDFRRYMYFQQIGAMGFAFKPPEIITREKPQGFKQKIEGLRNNVDRVIENSLGPSQAPVAKALITGNRAGISKEDNEAIKNAGLAHILSISGLHISLFAGIVFFTARFLMACVPGFALRRPIKKYAAVLGFVAAFAYTLLAGAEIPAQRSLIMLGAVFLAILLDRDPLSPRLLAFAALVVLILTPESLISASFQMSFSAVSAMIFFYDWQRERISRWHMRAGPFKKMALYFGGIAVTTILATLATAPFTVFHFQNLSLYGLIANALVIPLTGYVIMPAAALALILMPFGMAYYPLQIVGFGVAGMIGVSRWIAGFPHAMLYFASWPAAAFLILVLSILFWILWRGNLKYIFAVSLVISLIVIVTYRQPDILIAPEFRLVAVRGQDSLLLSSRRKEKFIRENWERMAGFPAGSSQSWPAEGREELLTCDPAACRIEKKDTRISILKAPEALAAECSWAQFILSFEPVKSGICHTRIIDKFDTYNNGAYALWLDDPIRIVNEGQGQRPWNSKPQKSQ